jgi:peptidoglycan/LPS O-acetylase OafA/YrhL
MKKTILIFAIAALVVILTGIWIFTTSARTIPVEILNLGVIIVLVGFAVFMGIKKLSNARRGEPTEDELSKKVLKRASSTAYFISIYMWLAIMYFSDKTKLETHTMIGAGILGMAIIFFLCWMYHNFMGITNE